MLNFENLKNLKKHIKYLQNKLNKNDVFLVGGCIRDILLNIEKDPKDIDIATNGQPKNIYRQINKNDISIFKTDKFGTITIIPHKKTKQKNPTQYELTPFRQEWDYADFRHPEKINRTNDIIQDSKRRDFTINCIYYYFFEYWIKHKQPQKLKDKNQLQKILTKNWFVFIQDKSLLILQDKQLIAKVFEKWKLKKEELKKLQEKNSFFCIEDTQASFQWLQILIDPWWGIQDIINTKIKAVWEPDDRLQEDALRIIRWARIPNILNQKIEKNTQTKSHIQTFDYDTPTWISMKKNFYLVQFVAKERIKEEIKKAFKNDNPFGFISIIDELNIIKFLFPSLYLTKWNKQPVRYHAFDTFTHTLLSLYHIQKINKDYLVKLSILYHDVGKPNQYYYASIPGIPKEEIRKMHWSYLHHAISWQQIAEKEFKKLWFSKKEFEQIWFYIRQHLVMWELLDSKPENVPKKIKKMLSQFWYQKLQNLIDITIADRQWQYNPLQSDNISSLKELKKLVKEIYEKQGEFCIKNLAINWNDIIKNLSISPWPEVGEQLDNAFNWVLQDIKNRNYKQKIIKYLQKQQKNNL